MDDFDDLLAGRDRADDFFADRAFAHLFGEILHRRQGDIGLQQRDANFAQRCVDVFLTQRAAPGESVENACQTFA